MASRTTPEQRSQALSSWESLNTALMKMPEAAAVRELIEHELLNDKRIDFIRRAFSRFNSLRRDEELRILMGGKSPW